MRINICQACSFARHGVKTRISIEHTCGLEPDQWPVPPERPYVPTKEDLDLYLKRLKELMEENPE